MSGYRPFRELRQIPLHAMMVICDHRDPLGGGALTTVARLDDLADWVRYARSENARSAGAVLAGALSWCRDDEERAAVRAFFGAKRNAEAYAQLAARL